MRGKICKDHFDRNDITGSRLKKNAVPLDMNYNNYNDNNEQVNKEKSEEYSNVEYLEEQEAHPIDCCSNAIADANKENEKLLTIISEQEKKMKLMEDKIDELRSISKKHRNKNYYLQKLRKKLRETIQDMKENKLISQAISEELKVQILAVTIII